MRVHRTLIIVSFILSIFVQTNTLSAAQKNDDLQALTNSLTAKTKVVVQQGEENLKKAVSTLSQKKFILKNQAAVAVSVAENQAAVTTSRLTLWQRMINTIAEPLVPLFVTKDIVSITAGTPVSATVKAEAVTVVKKQTPKVTATPVAVLAPVTKSSPKVINQTVIQNVSVSEIAKLRAEIALLNNATLAFVKDLEDAKVNSLARSLDRSFSPVIQQINNLASGNNSGGSFNFSETVDGLDYAGGVLSTTVGYTIPLTASTSEWGTFYQTPSTRITAGTGLSWSGNTLNATGGGGGTVNPGTLGQIAFYGADGTAVSATSSVFLASSGYLGIGKVSPTSVLDIVRDGSDADITLTEYKSSAIANKFVFQKAKGTVAAPQAIENGNGIGTIQFNGYGDSTFVNGALIAATTESTFTDSSAPAKLDFRTTAVGEISPTVRLTITSAGNVGIGTTSPFAKLSVAGQVVGEYFTATSTVATSTFAGGLSAASSLYVLQNGNVGIGKIAPTSKLHIEGNVGSNQSVGSNITNTNSGGRSSYYSYNDSGNYTGFQITGSAVGGLNLANQGSLFASQGLVLFTDGNVSSGGTNSISFRTGGYDIAQERMRISSTGNVGIGTTTPGSILTISNATAAEISIYNSTSLKNWRIGSGVGSGAVNTTFGIADGVTSRFLIDGSGNVGIASTTPGATLAVAGTVLGQTINTYGTGTSTFAGGLNLTSGCYAINGTCVGGAGGSGTVNSGTLGQIAFYNANGTAVSATSSVTINTNKSVVIGIATTTSTTLQVYGAQGSLAQFQSSNAATSFTQLDIVQPAGMQNVGDGFSLIALGSSYAGVGALAPDGAFLGANGGLSEGFSIGATHASAPIKFFTGGSAVINERMRITSTGLVGIGTSSPAYTLAVAGDINFTGGVYKNGILQSFSTTGSGTTGQVPYYAASGTSLTATSSLFITTAGTVGVGTTSAAGALMVNMDIGSLAQFQRVNTSASYSQIDIVQPGGNLNTNGDSLSIVSLGDTYATSGAFTTDTALIHANAGMSGGLSLISRHASAPMRFYTGGITAANERMIISSTGNVGIGTSTPAARLHVLSTTEQMRLAYDNSNYLSNTISSTGNATLNVVGSGGAITFSRNGTARLVIDSTGNVGIGTTTPANALSFSAGGIRGWNQSSGGIQIMNSLGASNSTIAGFANNTASDYALFNVLRPGGAVDSGDFQFYALGPSYASSGLYTSSSVIAQARANFTGGLKVGAEAGPLSFFAGGSALSDIGMTLTTGKNVGIGTTSPSALMHIYRTSPSSNTDYFQLGGGTVAHGITDLVPTTTYASIGPADTAFGGMFIAGYTDDATAAVIIDGNGAVAPSSVNTSVSIRGWKKSGTGRTALTGTEGVFSVSAGGNTPAFRVLANGNIGIGTSSPSANLSIKGSGTTTGKAFALTDSSNAEKFTILDNGNVGIGTSTPAGKLVVVGGSNGSGQVSSLVLQHSGTSANDNVVLEFRPANGLTTDKAAKITGIAPGGGDIDLSFITVNASTPSEIMRITGNGNVGIGTTTPTVALAVVGNAQFTAVTSGAYASDLNITSDGTLTTSASDIRLKENITEISTSTLDRLRSLKAYTFNWKTDPEHRTDVGLIAQEVEFVFPELVFTNKTDGFKGVNYSRLSIFLLKGIQEQQVQLDELKKYTTVLKLKEVHTEKLCVGSENDEVCITREDLRNLLQGHAAQGSSGGSSGGGDAPVPTPTEPTDVGSSTAPTEPAEEEVTPPEDNAPAETPAPTPEPVPETAPAPETSPDPVE